MIYETLTKRIIRGLAPARGLNVLDLCAAPGGKTTSMLNALPDGSLMVANEIVPQRAKILRENLLKWGYGEIMVTRSDSSRYASLGEMFDIIAVDAPCSGEGMMRKEAVAATQWSERLVEQCASLQREILANAAAALKPGGFLIYSTCTFNTEENEDNLRFAIEELGLLSATPELPEEYGIGKELSGPYRALRFMPHLTRGEGLFAAVLRKPGDHECGTSRDRERLKAQLRKKPNVVLDGFPMETEKGGKKIPAPELPLLCGFSKEYPCVELSEEEILNYLRHEAIALPPDTPRGFVAVCYHGWPLGFVKNIGTRANNLYPSEWRIRNL